MTHRNANDAFYAFWSKPTVDCIDGVAGIWQSYVVYPSSQRGPLERYTGWPRDIKEFHKNLAKDRQRLTTLQGHDDLHN